MPDPAARCRFHGRNANMSSLPSRNESPLPPERHRKTVERVYFMRSIIDWMLTFTPAYGKFFDRIPAGGKLLDIGCANGDSVRIFRHRRPDLEVYGVDIEEFPAAMEVLDGFARVDLSVDRIPFDDAMFDGIRLSHLLEHMERYDLLGSEIRRLLKPGGLVYVETPSSNSLRVPSLRIFADQGTPFNFHDDKTHIRPPVDPPELRRFLEDSGLSVLSSGIVRNPFKVALSPAIVAWGLLTRRRPLLTAAAWEISGWCSYAVGTRKGFPGGS